MKDATDKAIQECLSKWFTEGQRQEWGRLKRILSSDDI